MDNFIWNYVYRRVKNKPIYIKDNGFTSALFKDSQGVSVNVDAGRTEKEVIEDEECLHNYYNRNLSNEEIVERGENLIAILSLSKTQCEQANVYVKSDPIEGENENHALIQKTKDEIKLTKTQARQLAKMATIVKKYN